MACIENGVEYEHSVALLRCCEHSEEDRGWLVEILKGKMISKDRTSHTNIREATERWETVTAGTIRKWRQCEAFMRERNLENDEPPYTWPEIPYNTSISDKKCTKQAQKNLGKHGRHASGA